MEPDWQTEDGRVRLYRGDAFALLSELPKVDAVVTPQALFGEGPA